MNSIQPRHTWTSLRPKKVVRLKNPTTIYIHHTATVSGPDVPALLRGIQRYHMYRRGWFDIAYNFGVDYHGVIWELRGWGVEPGATKYHNHYSHAFVYIGNTQSHPVPDDAKRALAWLIDEAKRRYGPQVVRKHRDVAATACPGAYLSAWLDAGRPLPPVTPAPSLLRKGDRGPAVQQLQRDLTYLGVANLAPDGIFGRKTQRAVKKLQRFWGLSVDGIVGPKTRAVIDWLLTLTPQARK
ncbi:MAG: N-acetylmuramoyl-L-alanine amidase [Gammaproteobacteria bacterium]|nr:MAG: N-acetylmuramoyl-L-alanine amidase [Gammaproteobacteria bacterium]